MSPRYGELITAEYYIIKSLLFKLEYAFTAMRPGRTFLSYKCNCCTSSRLQGGHTWARRRVHPAEDLVRCTGWTSSGRSNRSRSYLTKEAANAYLATTGDYRLALDRLPDKDDAILESRSYRKPRPLGCTTRPGGKRPETAG